MLHNILAAINVHVHSTLGPLILGSLDLSGDVEIVNPVECVCHSQRQ